MGDTFPFQFGLDVEDLRHFNSIWHQNSLRQPRSSAIAEEHERFPDPLLPLQYDDFDAADDATPTSHSSKKRSHSDSTLLSTVPKVAQGQDAQWLYTYFPDLGPTLPSISQRTLPLGLDNPFHATYNITHPRLRARAKSCFAISTKEGVNGLVKFRLRPRKETGEYGLRQRFSTKQIHNADPSSSMALAPPTNLPPDFGRGLKLNATDAKLFKFYEIAFCAGRTLLPLSNGWLHAASMAPTSPLIKHSILSFASSYVLDYRPSQDLEKRANMHYRRAVILLSQLLHQNGTYQPGNEDVVLGALSILCAEDCVNWEGIAAGAPVPEGILGLNIAKTVLDLSDPGYNFHHPRNVQCNSFRRFMGNWCAHAHIFAYVMAPIEDTDASCPYPWLLEGTDRELRRIDGLIGLCPKLLHFYVQITHLAGRLSKDPTSIAIPKAGEILSANLTNFRQWSDLSEGFETSEDLMQSCELNKDGQVSDPTKVVELTAEAYLAAAQIYLQCRLFRRRRADPIVQRINERLLACIDRMPVEGVLFTAMTPLFSVVIAGVVANSEQHRAIIQKWFKGVISGPRGNVPPAWQALQMIWDWQDGLLVEEEMMDMGTGSVLGSPESEKPLSQRRPWWEEMVHEVNRNVGKMSLC